MGGEGIAGRGQDMGGNFAVLRVLIFPSGRGLESRLASPLEVLERPLAIASALARLACLRSSALRAPAFPSSLIPVALGDMGNTFSETWVTHGSMNFVFVLLLAAA
jgi:hypothetical protein